MIDYCQYEIWFASGSQHLYGEDVLKQVFGNSKEVAHSLDEEGVIPVSIVFKGILTSASEILKFCSDANSDSQCVGVICWMHTFSPAKMWINGLKIFHKPLLHLHTQFNSDIPWQDIDMDFMNLNQSAHGGREFGHINTRMRLNRRVVVGHWKDRDVHHKIAVWSRASVAWMDSQNMKIARFGDNMRQVAVTEGDKVSAQIQFGYSVNGFGLGDLVKYTDEVSEKEIDTTIETYFDTYLMMDSIGKSGDQHTSLRDAARIEIGIRTFLSEGGFSGFTTTFENLTGLSQLPGIAVQRLMADGYGFGAEGDWKTAALVRSMKVMAHGLKGGNSFMEDYTYHFNPQRMAVLGAHMLEICPSIATDKPSCEIHPLGIGGKSDPVRLVFESGAGPAINASMIDMGNRFRLIVNKVNAIEPEAELPKLPVARVLWQSEPDVKSAAEAWILAGGSHHTCFSQNLSPEHLEVYAEMLDIEFLLIDHQTTLRQFKNELKWNDLYYHLNRGI